MNQFAQRCRTSSVSNVCLFAGCEVQQTDTRYTQRTFCLSQVVQFLFSFSLHQHTYVEWLISQCSCFPKALCVALKVLICSAGFFPPTLALNVLNGPLFQIGSPTPHVAFVCTHSHLSTCFSFYPPACPPAGLPRYDNPSLGVGKQIHNVCVCVCVACVRCASGGNLWCWELSHRSSYMY